MMRSLKPLLICSVLCLSVPALAAEWSGYVAAEARWFTQSPLSAQQHGGNLSISAEPEFYHAWNEQSLSFKPFVRWDQHDDERSHSDIRELLFTHAGDGWEFKAGIGKVFWGVTEAYHLVDVINQTDLLENPDGEQKLGQPMVKLSLERDWGTWDLFFLPVFRERTFPGRDGRLRSPLPVNDSQTQYADGRGEWSSDWALRWSHYFGDWDVGLSHFHGTGREPTLLPGLDGQGRPVLIPRYELIDQTGLDLQATLGSWLWKLEVMRRSGQGDAFFATTGGFEYTLVGLADTASDLGMLLELMYDERGKDATVPFNNDVFMGLRWTANDVEGSELLAGVIYDWRSKARLLNIEASRRLGADWTLSLQARFWASAQSDPALAGFSQEDYVEVRLARYF